METHEETHLRDLLYLDEEKAASIYSQLFGGLLTEATESTEQAQERRRGLALPLGPIRPEIGSAASDRSSVVESRVLHHSLLLEIEKSLEDGGALVDINEAIGEQAPSEALARQIIGDASYVRVEGWASIEDYDRIGSIAGDFPDLVAFMNRAAAAGLEDSEELKAVRAQIEELRAEAMKAQNKQNRGQALRQVRQLETQLEEAVKAASNQVESLEPWFIEGVQKWLKALLPGRITLRVYPFESVPRFQVFGNLKREAFVDADLGNLRFAYGARPNVRLTMLGLITSLPAENAELFDPLSEFKDEHGALLAEDEETGFERGFRGVFEGLEAMENMARFSRFPNITVYPLAVYRRVPIRA